MQPLSFHCAETTFQPEDEIDLLFSQMSQLKAPIQLVARILKHIKCWPGHLSSAAPLPDPMGDEAYE